LNPGRFKESLSVAVAMVTYDELLKTAEHMLGLAVGAGDRPFE
jgi:hypothetical protein